MKIRFISDWDLFKAGQILECAEFFGRVPPWAESPIKDGLAEIVDESSFMDRFEDLEANVAEILRRLDWHGMKGEE